MKKILLSLFSLTIFISIYSCSKDNNIVSSPPPSISTDTLGTITGTVFDLNNIPINNVNVICFNSSAWDYYSSMTDSLGKYKIKNIRSNNYKLYTSKNGYSSDSINVTIHSRDSINRVFQVRQTTWMRMAENANSFDANWYYTLYVNPQVTVFASSRQNAVFFNASGLMKTTNFGTNWLTGISYPCTSKLFHIADNNLFMFTGNYQNSFAQYVGENIFYKSNDNGNTWQELVNLGLGQINQLNVVFTSNAYYMSISGFIYPSTNYVDLLYKSVNQGSTWTSINPISGYNVKYVGKTSNGRVFIRDFSDSLFFSINGTSWQKKIVTDPIQKQLLFHSQILPSGEMVIGYNNKFYISNTDGESYNVVNSNLTSNLPDVENSVFNSRNEIFSTLNGRDGINSRVYKSTNKFITMENYDDGLPENYTTSGIYVREDYAYLLCNGYIYRTTKKTTE